jgi:hypothetical protein
MDFSKNLLNCIKKRYKNDIISLKINRIFIDGGIMEQNTFLGESDKLNKLSKIEERLNKHIDWIIFEKPLKDREQWFRRTAVI